MKVNVLFKTIVYWINLSPLQERTVKYTGRFTDCRCEQRNISGIFLFVHLLRKKVLSIDRNTLFVCLGLLRSGT